MTAAPSPSSTTQLVGRDRELAAMHGALDRLGAGDRAVIAVVAPGGMGKTTLLAELGRAAQRAGIPVLPGRGSEFEREQPFSLIVDALDDAVADADPRALAQLGPDRIADLASVLPSVEDLADAAFGTSAVASSAEHGATTAAERPRYHRAVRALLEVITSSRGFVLVLDDVHWADEATVELVLHLLRRPPRVPHVIALGALLALAFGFAVRLRTRSGRTAA